jgi:Flp pilus assembly protein CpaB
VGSGKTLVIAAKALKPGTILQAADVHTIPWASEQVPKGTFETAEQVTGSTVFDSIGEGEPVLATHLATQTSSGGADIPPGMRAVSVHVTDSAGVLALLRPGQQVDVQVVVGRGNIPGETTVRTALENLKVLSVIPQPEQGSQGQSLPVVTLLAKPSDTDVLAVADSGARVRLTLRNPLDGNTHSRGSLSLNGLMRQTGAWAGKP